MRDPRTAPFVRPPHYEAMGQGMGARRRRPFPEQSSVRADKMKQMARSLSDGQLRGVGVPEGQLAGGPQAGGVSSVQILTQLLLDPVNILLLFGPLGIAAAVGGYGGALVFTLCFLGLIPLAKLLGDATEHLAENLNETVGGLLNATFGNAVEMIITISAIRRGHLEIVKKSLLGSILSNLLLVLGMSFFAGGIGRFEQEFSGGAALINITMLLVGIMSFSLPTIFAFGANEEVTLKISRFDAMFVAVGYIAYLVFQLFTHAEFFDDAKGDDDKDGYEFVDTEGDRIAFKINEAGKLNFLVNNRLKVCDLTKVELGGRTLSLSGTSTGDWSAARSTTVQLGQEDVARKVVAMWARGPPEEDKTPEAVLGIPWAIVLLLLSTIIVAVLSEYMVDAIDGLVTEWNVPEAFIGVILLPIVGNACEHLSAVRMAIHNKIATAIAISIGSSTQIAIFVMPFSVMVAKLYGQPLDLNMHPMGLSVLFLSVLVVSSIVSDGKSNWLEGFMLMLSYCLVAVLYWYTPTAEEPLEENL